MIRLLEGVLAGPRSDVRRADGASWHLHRYTRSGDDPFSGSSLYRCRCGVVRPAI
ncbi:hypothetical protein [Modestobacter altitudinis]|uniref:hypothetical protein n=1 Tax=Modestobacter altitudinis TaxID=2213158 RepID=UPI001485E126|nr:hypothetical protein [Modestobacter altitudinis]